MKFHRIAPQLCGEQLGDTRMGRADEGDSRRTGACGFSAGTCGRGWLAWQPPGS